MPLFSIIKLQCKLSQFLCSAGGFVHLFWLLVCVSLSKSSSFLLLSFLFVAVWLSRFNFQFVLLVCVRRVGYFRSSIWNNANDINFQMWFFNWTPLTKFIYPIQTFGRLLLKHRKHTAIQAQSSLKLKTLECNFFLLETLQRPPFILSIEWKHFCRDARRVHNCSSSKAAMQIGVEEAQKRAIIAHAIFSPVGRFHVIFHKWISKHHKLCSIPVIPRSVLALASFSLCSSNLISSKFAI